MIITCTNCNKKFDINSDLIPINGRLLECSSCNHQWFFKIETKKSNFIKTNDVDKPKIEKKLKKIVNKDELENKEDFENTEFIKDLDIKKKQKKLKISNIIVVLIISFIAFIILIDTFKYPISKIVPNIEFILYNLYESIKDIRLFFNDLI